MKYLYEGENPYREAPELGKVGEFAYYLGIPDLERPAVVEVLNRIPAEMAEEYRALVDEIGTRPEAFTLKQRVAGFNPPEPGTVIEFETADVDGRPVASKDLFAKSKVTLVNIWRTWCAPCVAELPELDALNREYAARGGSVVTCCADADSSELIAEAKRIAGDYSFVNLVRSDSIDAALPWNCTPMSYFVDREGKVLAYPIVGADMDACAAGMETWIGGGESEPPLAADRDDGGTATYTVAVVDQNGDPVPGVRVLFCDASTCSMAVSDENGVIVYEGAARSYHVEVLKVPKGYRFDYTDDIYTGERSCGMSLTVTKEQ